MTNATNNKKLTKGQMNTLRAIDNGADNVADLAYELSLSASSTRARAKTLAAKGMIHSGLGCNAEGTGRDYLCFELTNAGIDLIDESEEAE